MTSPDFSAALPSRDRVLEGRLEAVGGSPTSSAAKGGDGSAVADQPDALALAQELEALIETSQALSREIVLERVVERITRAAGEHAGASRCVTLLSYDGEMRIVATSLRGGQFETDQCALNGIEAGVPVSVVKRACETRQTVSMGDLGADPRAIDPYFASAEAVCLLCLPLLAQQRLVGLIYLESDRSVHAFTAQRQLLLQLLASQAAISIENALLFQNLQRAEQHARQARDEAQQEYDLIPVQVWRTDAKGALEAANKQWWDFTGFTEEEAKNYQTTCHPDDQDKVFGLLARLHETGVPGQVECRMRRHDGEYRRVLARAAPLRDETGTVIKWHGTNIDIEELKRAEQAQEALARVSRVTALGELAVSIAHEVNQPLMAIVTNAATCLRWLTMEPGNIAEARVAAERIVRDGHRAGDVIASIRAMAQKSPPKFAAVDVNDVIREVLALARNELHRHEIGIETFFAGEARLASADPVQIQQVVLNLVVNGIEAMDGNDTDPRVLSISTNRTGAASIVVSVADTGRGLTLEEADQVFDTFFTSKAHGIGMGLSICRSIIEGHGGRITVSPRLPRGCTFSFELPTLAKECPVEPGA